MSAKKVAKVKTAEASKPQMRQVPVLATGKVMVLLLVGLGLAGVFFASFMYRMDNPSLIVKSEPAKGHGGERAGGMPPGMGQGMDGAMNEIAGLMGKLKENPNDLDLLIEVAEKFLMVEAYDKAGSILEKADKLSPDNPEVLNGLGISFFGQDKFPEAAAKFERVIALTPMDYRAPFNLGLLYKNGFKDKDKANKYFQMVLESPLADPKAREQAKAEMVK